MPESSALNLPGVFRAKVLEIFETCSDPKLPEGDKRRIIGSPTAPQDLRRFSVNDFGIELHLCPLLKRKTINEIAPVQHDERKGSSSETSSAPHVEEIDKDKIARVEEKSPFRKLHNEIVLQVGDHHEIFPNLHYMFKPMLILATKTIKLQEKPLEEIDIIALWSTIKAMNTPQVTYVGFYSCGWHAGMSQEHRHMQLFPKPEETEGLGFKLWPSRQDPTPENGIHTKIPGVPFKHFVSKLAPNNTGKYVYDRYAELLKGFDALKDAGKLPDHNILLTAEWIALIPRSKTVGDKKLWGANGMGMLGVICVRDMEDRERWRNPGYWMNMRALGIAREDEIGGLEGDGLNAGEDEFEEERAAGQMDVSVS